MPLIKSLFGGKKWIITISVAIALGLGAYLGPKTISDWYVQQGKSLGSGTDAITNFDQALRLNPQNAQAYFYRGRRHSVLKEWDQALQDFTKVISLDPGYPFVYSERGYVYDKLGNLDAAYQDYTQAIQRDPNDTLSYVGRGGVNEELGHTQDAVLDYTKFLSLYQKDDATSAHFRDRIKELSTQTP